MQEIAPKKEEQMVLQAKADEVLEEAKIERKELSEMEKKLEIIAGFIVFRILGTLKFTGCE